MTPPARRSSTRTPVASVEPLALIFEIMLFDIFTMAETALDPAISVMPEAMPPPVVLCVSVAMVLRLILLVKLAGTV